MEHTNEEENQNEISSTVEMPEIAALNSSEGEQAEIAAESVDSNEAEIVMQMSETPSQQQRTEGEDEGPEEWDLHPQLPSDQDLLYPGQDILEMELEFLDDEKQEDQFWQARTGLDFDTLCGAIETVIFMSDKPVAINKIKTLIDEDMPLRVIHESLSRLQEEYETRHHGLRLVEVAEGYQFRTKATYSKYVQDLFKVNSLVLSPTALEVLAIIAYKQPVAKTEVDKIRGVDSGHIVRGLIDKRLARVVGRSDEMGRPVLYGTTPEFLEVFNLANIGDLPSESELQESVENNVGKISDIKNIVSDGDKSRFVFDDIDELDSLAASIKEIAADTDFTSALKTSEKQKLKGEVTSDKPQTAFDILEDYVSKQVIINANNEAQVSEMMSDSADPQVIRDFTQGPFNTPEVVEEDEEDFQMIDLDTGLPIEMEDEEELETENLSGIDLLKEDEDEAAELSKALDEAFERLTGEPLEEGELGLRDEGLEEKEEQLEAKTEEMIEKARAMDFDLEFMKDINPSSIEPEENQGDSDQ